MDIIQYSLLSRKSHTVQVPKEYCQNAKELVELADKGWRVAFEYMGQQTYAGNPGICSTIMDLNETKEELNRNRLKDILLLKTCIAQLVPDLSGPNKEVAQRLDANLISVVNALIDNKPIIQG